MRLRPRILIPILMLALSILVGCGGSTFNVQNPPPPPPQNISISFQSQPAANISLNASTTVSAVVSNDPANSGVDWEVVLNCQGPNCGTQPCAALLSPSDPCGNLLNSSGQPISHSNSGDTITYRPPSAFPVPGNVMNIEIMALATADTHQNVSDPVSVTAFGNVLQGTYVFQVRGNDSTFSSGYPYQLTGEVYLDGNGNVTSANGDSGAGQQTLNSYDVNSNLDSTTSAISGGSYFVGTDGRGTLIINTTDPSGDAIEEDFSLVVTSSSDVSIAQLAGTLTNSQGVTTLLQSGTGTLELQDPAAAGALPSAGYAFTAIGTDSSATPLVYGGIFNIDSPGGISGKGTLTDQGYNGVFTSCSSANGFAGSTVSSAGTPGVVVFNLVTTCAGFAPTQITGYIIDTSHLQLIETDGSYLAAGPAVGQGSATGTFTSFSGDYIFDVLGMDLSSFLTSSLNSVDVLSADGSGNLSGYTDTAFFSNVDGSPALISSQFSGIYQLDNKGIGRVHLRLVPAPVPFFDPSVVMYLTAPPGTPGAPALVLYSAAANQLYPALGVGVSYPQAPPAQSISFGNGEQYGFVLTQENGSEFDGSGQFNATSSPGGGTLSGLVDSSINPFPSAPLPLTGVFACPQGASSCPDPFGRFSASSLTVDGTISTVDYFMIDQDHGFIIETDALNSFQVSLGYFAERCDVTLANNCQQSEQKAHGKHDLKGHGVSGQGRTSKITGRSN